VTPVLEKPYISVSINPENIIFWHFTNGGHTRKSIMVAPMFLRIKRSIYTHTSQTEKCSRCEIVGLDDTREITGK
jgi:hypothetical protein